VTGAPTHDIPDRQSRRTATALSLVAVVLTGTLAVLFGLLPQSAQPWNLTVVGALALFAAARVGFWPAVVFTVLALGLKDLAVFALRGWEPYLLGHLFFAGYAVLGWVFLRKSTSAARIGLTTVAGSVWFFVVTNFVSWLGQALPYGYSLAGLADCYISALPFFRGTLAGDLLFGAALFGAHAVLVARGTPARHAVVEVEGRG
jgi:hypothetical protein